MRSVPQRYSNPIRTLRMSFVDKKDSPQLVSSISKEANSNTTDLDSSRERSGIFSVARSSTAPPFEKQESILNEMAEFVKIFVIFPQMFSLLSWRNDWCHALVNGIRAVPRNHEKTGSAGREGRARRRTQAG